INNYGNNINIYKTTGINRYWKTNYDFGTNETGLSILGDGWRSGSTGGFTDTKFATFLRTQSAHYFRLYGNNNVGATLTVNNTAGGALRLIKNE
ncbi:MAG: hypothetical protein RBT13_05675, partial [Bacteroidales bacterium]|nr:hypothetical protein [Bacteroidales bacterium]